MSTQPIVLGPLEALLEDSQITAIHIHPAGIRYEKAGQSHDSSLAFESEAQRRQVIDSIVQAGGKTLSTANPVVECVLSDGTRIHAEDAPLSLSMYKRQ